MINKFKKIYRKLNLRYNEFKIHPVTRTQALKALLRYVIFNTIGKFKNEQKFHWIRPLKFYASVGDASMAGNIYFGLAELDESLFTIFLLREDDEFVDIGANLGHYSLLASGISNARSIAIEPIPVTFYKLEKQVILNGLSDRIDLLNIGLADENKELRFTTDKGTMNRVATDAENEQVTMVSVKKLDDICYDKAPVLIKLDVEGFEKFVLGGAINTLKKSSLKAIILELNGSGEQFGVSDEDVYEIMIGNGFLPYRFISETRKLERLQTYNTNQYNTIFIRDLDFCVNRTSGAPRIRVLNKEF